MDPRTEARSEQEVRDSLAEVRGRVVAELRAGDSLSGREVFGSIAGGMLLGLGIVLVLVGFDIPGREDPLLPAVPLGLVVLVLAWLALRPVVRRQVGLARTLRRLSGEVRALKAQLPPGADDGPGVLRLYYGQRFTPVMIAIFALMGLLLVVRLLR